MKNDQLAHDIARLAVSAPDTLLPGVLVSTGIADGYVRRTSVLGDLLVAFGTKGVTAVELADDPGGLVTTYERRFGRKAIPVDRVPTMIERHLDAAIVAGRPGLLPVDLDRLTAFQTAVLRAAATIPRGEVRPYGWVAKEIGKPGAVRAVGTALASNPVPVIIPCHRVVRSDGTLGDYSLGEPENKRALLEFEGLDTSTLEAKAERRALHRERHDRDLLPPHLSSCPSYRCCPPRRLRLGTGGTGGWLSPLQGLPPGRRVNRSF